MDFSRKDKIGVKKHGLTSPSGKRHRTPEEFIELCKKKGHPCCRVILYNKEEGVIVEALKDMTTKHRHLLYAGRPRGSQEEQELNRLLTRENLLNAKNNRQIEIIIGGDDYKKPELKSR